MWKSSERWRKQRGLSNFKWEQDFDRSYEENKKKFWKEVRRVRKGGLRTEETAKDVNGRLLRGNEARKRWAEYFEELLNVQEDREADIVAVGGVQVPIMGEENEREITIEEVKRALNQTKGGKAPGMDGVRVEMLKEGGVTVLEWLVRLFNICFMLSIVPVGWVIACMVPLYKGKGDMLFSFKNKYHYTYPNTYIALYHSHAKVTCNTHTQKQEIVNHPSLGSSLVS